MIGIQISGIDMKLMTFIFRILVFIMLSLFFSCSPKTKESYIKDFGEFIKEVNKDHNSFNKKDWQEADEKYDKYAGEWKSKFQDDFIWKDKLLINSYEAQYKGCKMKVGFSGFMDKLFNDFNKLKKRVKYYSENDMEQDMAILNKRAQELGDDAVKKLDKILKQLELETKR
jgi:hypothetical protein